MLKFLDLYAIKWLKYRGEFTEIPAERGRYWGDNFKIENNSKTKKWVFILEEKE